MSQTFPFSTCCSRTEPRSFLLAQCAFRHNLTGITLRTGPSQLRPGMATSTGSRTVLLLSPDHGELSMVTKEGARAGEYMLCKAASAR